MWEAVLTSMAEIICRCSHPGNAAYSFSPESFRVALGDWLDFSPRSGLGLKIRAFQRKIVPVPVRRRQSGQKSDQEHSPDSKTRPPLRKGGGCILDQWVSRVCPATCVCAAFIGGSEACPPQEATSGGCSCRFTRFFDCPYSKPITFLVSCRRNARGALAITKLAHGFYTMQEDVVQSLRDTGQRASCFCLAFPELKPLVLHKLFGRANVHVHNVASLRECDRPRHGSYFRHVELHL